MMLKALLPLHGKKEKPPARVAWKRDPGATRTRDPQLRRLLLYPTELRNQRAANIVKNYDFLRRVRRMYDIMPRMIMMIACDSWQKTAYTRPMFSVAPNSDISVALTR